MVNGYSNNIQQMPIQANQAVSPQAQPAQLQAVPTTAPATTSPINPSAVSINIISPSVYGPQNQAPIPYAPIYSYPQAQSFPPPIQANATATATATAAPTPPAPAPAAAPAKTKPKNVTPLTDDYIQTVEGFLNSPSKDTRVMGAKHVMSRFKEDDSRLRDAALTALLNKSLKDDSNDVRLVGMTTIAAGYAAGDDTTVSLLNKLQKDNSNYNEDARLAAQALSKMAEQIDRQKVEVPEN